MSSSAAFWNTSVVKRWNRQLLSPLVLGCQFGVSGPLTVVQWRFKVAENGITHVFSTDNPFSTQCFQVILMLASVLRGVTTKNRGRNLSLFSHLVCNGDMKAEKNSTRLPVWLEHIYFSTLILYLVADKVKAIWNWSKCWWWYASHYTLSSASNW